MESTTSSLVCKIDTREADLLKDMSITIGDRKDILLVSEMLTVGDILILENNNPLLLIERKTVRDLIQSLRDERYHDQRRRWAHFQSDFPNARVSLWLEGDLLSASMDETLRSSLLNSLLRLQSLHHVIVHQVRGRNAFVQSLVMVMNKFLKNPLHLVDSTSSTTTSLSSPVALEMRQYKKTLDQDADKFWRCILSGIPGVSIASAEKIATVFPHLVHFMDEYKELGHDALTEKLSKVEISSKRKLGKALSEKIVRHLFPLSL